MEQMITTFIMLSIQVVFVAAGCSGQYDLPVQIGPANTHRKTGRATYLAPDVNSLANQLMLDISSLTLAYAKVLAQDAFYIQENNEITYRFIIAKGNAQLNQFKIISTTLGDKKVNIQWDIIKSYVTYTAYRKVKIHRNRRRRRWLFGGRRRCIWKQVPRGVTQRDIQKIQGTLHATMTSTTMSRSGVWGRVFVKERVIDMRSKQSRGTCAAWNRVIKLSLVRGCTRRTSAVPKAFSKVINPLNRKTSVKKTIPFPGVHIFPGFVG